MPRREPRRRPVRPSLLLWRWRHLVVAVCVAGASLLALSLLRPPETAGREVLVLARDVTAGQVVEEADVARRSLPESALPGSGLAEDGVVGQRAAVALPAGTVLTGSMTSGADAVGLGAEEQLVQVPVEVGAGLAQPGVRVDVVGEASVVTSADDNAGGAANTLGQASAGQEETGSAPLDGISAGAGAASDGAAAPGAAASDAAASGTALTTTQEDRVLASGARVVRVEPVDDASQFRAGSKVTLVTLAVRHDDASLVVEAATHESLGLIMSPS